MAWLPRSLFLAACASLVAVVAGTSVTAPKTSTYFDEPADSTASKLAFNKSEDLCRGGFKGAGDLASQRGARRKDLERQIGGDNVMRKILEKANSTAELESVAQEEISPAWVGERTGALAILIILIALYLLCCWTACPCCTCCRCCARERKTHMLVKLLGFVLYCGLVVGIVLTASVAASGIKPADDGFSNFGCTSASLMNMTLNGMHDPDFIGMLPFLGELDGLDKLLGADSNFMKDLFRILDETAIIDSSIIVAGQTLLLLTDMLNDPANIAPGGVASHHKCESCAAVMGQLAPLLAELNQGVATALRDARAEVKTQLTGEGAGALQGIFRTAAAPLVVVKNMVRDSISGLIEGDGIPDAVDYVHNYGTPVVAVLIAWGLLVAACGGMSWFCCIVRPKGKGGSSGSKNPYSKTTHRCACLSMCCACPLAWVTLFVSGVLIILTTVLSGLCLVLDDISGDSIVGIAPALGMNLSSMNDSKIMFSIIDNCFADTAGNNSNLLDIITITNATGDAPTMRQEIVDKSKQRLSDQFDKVGAMVANTSLGLAQMSFVTDLRALLRENPVATWIIPDPLTISQTYPALLTASDDLKLFPVTSLACLDHTPLSGLTGFSIPGMNTFDAALAFYGTQVMNTNGYACGKTVVCDPAADAQTKLRCSQANQYMGQKQRLTSSAEQLYRCDVFEHPSNPLLACDPLYMVGSASAGYTSDCIELKRKIEYCTLDEFNTYVRGFDARIEKTLRRVDDATLFVSAKITSDMEGLVTQYFISAIDRIVAGSSCGFLTKTYREFIDGLCYQGLWGLIMISRAYVGLAAVTIGLIVLMYIVWRRAVDNFNKFKPGSADCSNTSVVPTPA